MTDSQVKIAAKLLAVKLLWEASEEMDEHFKDLFVERAKGRLSLPEKRAIEGAITDIAQDLLGKNIRFKNVREIINFARKS